MQQKRQSSRSTMWFTVVEDACRRYTVALARRGGGALLLFVLSIGAVLSAATPANAATCKPGNGVTYTCDIDCQMVDCDISTITFAVCNGLGDPSDGKCVICGKSASETITGTDGDDVICAAGGGDTIDGGMGDDIISGGGGGDAINDLSGNNVVYGDAGDDVIVTGDGDDVLFGGKNEDELDAGGGSNYLDGGDHDDILVSAQAAPGIDQCLIETEGAMPADFNAVQGESGFEYNFLFLFPFAVCSSPIPFMDCGNSYSGDGCQLNSTPDLFIMRDDTRDLLLIDPSLNTGAVGAAVEYTATEASSYRAVGSFAPASECFSNGIGLRFLILKNADLDDPLFDETVLPPLTVDPDDPFSGTGERSFDVLVELGVNDAIQFTVLSPAGAITDDLTAFNVEITSQSITNPEEVLGSRLCGGDGEDELTTTGPGHQCLDGGQDDSTDTCTYTGLTIVGSRDVGTARNCNILNGSVSTRALGCGCR